jgi:hypothetical protein
VAIARDFDVRSTHVIAIPAERFFWSPAVLTATAQSNNLLHDDLDHLAFEKMAQLQPQFQERPVSQQPTITDRLKQWATPKVPEPKKAGVAQYNTEHMPNDLPQKERTSSQ